MRKDKTKLLKEVKEVTTDVKKPIKIIACITGDNFSGRFFDCWNNLVFYCFNNNIQLLISRGYSNNIYYARQKCLIGDTFRGIEQKPFDGKLEYDYILWIDSDQVFIPEQLKKLIECNKDIVSGYYAMEGQISEDMYIACGTWDLKHFKEKKYMPMHTLKNIHDKKDKDGLVEVDFSGLGFMLVKKGVFEKIRYPWFEPRYTEFKLDGIKIKDFSMEDVGFCMKAREQGFKVFVDTTVRVGHEKKIVL